MAFENEIAKRGFALRARPLITDVPEPEWEEINKSFKQLENLKEEIEKKSHTKENVNQQLFEEREKLLETERKNRETEESYETLKREVGLLQQQLDVLKTKRSILGFEDAENQSDESSGANLSLRKSPRRHTQHL